LEKRTLELADFIGAATLLRRGGANRTVHFVNAVVEQAVKIYTTLPESIFLRAADCLHLVTALHHGLAEICTHEARQTRADSALGLTPVSIV
jgi:predicted nucleic acid-binding protein